MNASMAGVRDGIGRSGDSRILRAALAVSAGAVVVKLIATGKEFTLAGAYGRSDAMDAFLMASMIPALIINVTAESMNQALAPTLIRVRMQGGMNCAQDLLSNALLRVVLLMAGVAAVIALLIPLTMPMVASHFGAEKLELTIQLSYFLLPVVVITGIASNCTVVLNTVESFAWPTLAQALVPLTLIVSALLFSRRMGIWALVYGSVAGATLHLTAVGWMMRRHGYRLTLQWTAGNAEATREVTRQYWRLFASSAVASGGIVVDQSMAAMLAAGSVAALAYANRFVSVVLTFSAGAIAAAVTPYLSRMVAERDWSGCRESMRRWVRGCVLAAVPVTVGLIAGGRGLVRLAYQHGAFGPQDGAVVTSVFLMYSLQIPFFVPSRVYYRLLIAMQRTDLVLYCGLINLGLDIVLNLVFMRWFGVAGIALATSVWTVTTFLFLRHYARRLLRHNCDGEERVA